MVTSEGIEGGFMEIRWGRDVFVYGEADLKKTHAVLEFLSKEGKAKSLHYYKEGYHLISACF